mmetsp:Transcript_98768/g.235431  ORF Transcript_98768/g.235431 Transcript_98768/m.235431 type:complete len:204 (-) Transcript_98768:204-815(-)
MRVASGTAVNHVWPATTKVCALGVRPDTSEITSCGRSSTSVAPQLIVATAATVRAQMPRPALRRTRFEGIKCGRHTSTSAASCEWDSTSGWGPGAKATHAASSALAPRFASGGWVRSAEAPLTSTNAALVWAFQASSANVCASAMMAQGSSCCSCSAESSVLSSKQKAKPSMHAAIIAAICWCPCKRMATGAGRRGLARRNSR